MPTDTETDVYKYMLWYQSLMGEPPTMRDIRKEVKGLNHRSSVQYALKQMENEGLVEQTKPRGYSRRWRAIKHNNPQT